MRKLLPLLGNRALGSLPQEFLSGALELSTYPPLLGEIYDVHALALFQMMCEVAEDAKNDGFMAGLREGRRLLDDEIAAKMATIAMESE